MKRIFLALAVVISAMAGMAQDIPQYIGSNRSIVTIRNDLLIDSAARLPLDTLATAPVGSLAHKGDSVYHKRIDGFWYALGPGGGGGGNMSKSADNLMTSTGFIRFPYNPNNSVMRYGALEIQPLDATTTYFMHNAYYNGAGGGDKYRADGKISEFAMTNELFAFAIGPAGLAGADATIHNIMTIGQRLGPEDVWIKSLDDVTGIPKMVTTTDGILGYQAIPTGGGNTGMGVIVASGLVHLGNSDGSTTGQLTTDRFVTTGAHSINWKGTGNNNAEAFHIFDDEIVAAPGSPTGREIIRIMPLDRTGYTTPVPWLLSVAATAYTGVSKRDNVSIWGWGVNSGGGAAVSGQTGIAYSLEHHFENAPGNVIDAEAHLFWLTKLGVQERLFSYTIAEATNYIDFYQTVSRWGLHLTNDRVYYSIQPSNDGAQVSLMHDGDIAQQFNIIYDKDDGVNLNLSGALPAAGSRKLTASGFDSWTLPKLGVDAGGELIIDAATPFRPATSGSVDLGNSSYLFGRLWAQNMRLTGTMIVDAVAPATTGNILFYDNTNGVITYGAVPVVPPALWTETGSDIYRDSKVMIGSASAPSYNLHVSDVGNVAIVAEAAGSTNDLAIFRALNSYGEEITIFNTGGSYGGAGALAPQHGVLYSNHYDGMHIAAAAASGQPNSGINFYTGGSAVANKRFFINETGAIYAHSISAATASDVLYYNSTTKEMTYGAAPTGTVINNNAANRLVSGSATPGTLNAQTNLTWDGSVFTAKTANSGLRMQEYTGGSSLWAFYADGITPAGNNWSMLFDNTNTEIYIGSNHASLYLYTGGSPAITINSNRAVAFDNSFGTSGYFLKSNGTGAAPTWAQGGDMLLNATNTMGSSARIVFGNLNNNSQVKIGAWELQGVGATQMYVGNNVYWDNTLGLIYRTTGAGGVLTATSTAFGFSLYESGTAGNAVTTTNASSLLMIRNQGLRLEHVNTASMMYLNFTGSDGAGGLGLRYDPGTNKMQVAHVNNTWADIAQLSFASAADANYVVPSGATTVKLVTISANRTLTLPAAGNAGKLLLIINENSAGFAWQLAGGAAIDASGASITSLTNDTNYIFVQDGTSWVKMN